MSELRVSLDENTKQEAENLFKSMGISLSNAVKMFVQQSINEGGFPFKPHAEKTPNDETLEAIKDLERGGGYTAKDNKEFYKKLGI